jgi:Eukaryotic translation initiation factor 3 subunit G
VKCCRSCYRSSIALVTTAAHALLRLQVRVLAEQQRTSRAAAERKKWARFGVAAEVADNHSYTLTSQEQVMMETPQESREADENPSNVGDR